MHIFVLTIPVLLFFPWWDSVSLCVLSWHVGSPERALVFRLAMPVLTRLHIIFWSYVEDRKTLDFWGDKPFGLFPVALPIWKRWQNAMWNGKKELGMLLSRHKWAVWQDIQGPLPKFSPPRDYAGSLGPCASIKEGWHAVGRRLCEFQHTGCTE